MLFNPSAPAVIDVKYDATQRYVPEQPLYGAAVQWPAAHPKTVREAILRAARDARGSTEHPDPGDRFRRIRLDFGSMGAVDRTIKRLVKLQQTGYAVTWSVIAARRRAA